MDDEPLVAGKIREGRALVSELVADRVIDVVVAFWVKPSGVGYWRFFIGSEQLTRMEFSDAIYRISLSLDRIDRKATMGLHEHKLISPSDPIALDAITFRDQRLTDEPTILRGSQLGHLEVDEAFIDPKVVGTLSRQDVIQRVAALLGREGRLERIRG
jgi:hypothetical protein